jgi:tRNA(fMet)-specific endonuclease VapC
MIVLDTDHLSVLQHPESLQARHLLDRMRESPDQDFLATVVSLEEQTRGWLAHINRFQDLEKQIPAYDRLAELVQFYARWEVMRIDRLAAAEFRVLRNAKVRIGTMDLKIASIVLGHAARLLSANLSDFQKVPGLWVENWLVP